MKLTRILSAMLLILALVLCLSLASADGKVLVVPRVEDLLMTGDAVDADTQVIVLAAATSKVANQASEFLTQRGAPAAMYGKFKRMKSYTESKLSEWKKASNAKSVLVAQLRSLEPDEVLWYCDPNEAGLRSYIPELLKEVIDLMPDPTYRASEAYDQYGCFVASLTDLTTNETTDLTEPDWMSSLRTKWGELTVPEVPDMPELNAEGFTDGEPFTYIDTDKGIWYYVSSEIKVSLTRHVRESGVALTWYEAEVWRRAGSDEHLHVYAPDYSKKTYKGKTLSANWVLTVNSDYHQKRGAKQAGLIIRSGDLKYTDQLQKTNIRIIPNMDNLLLTKDGGFEVYPATQLTAEKAMEMNACDVLTFGPLLVKDGRWRQVLNTYHASREPRTAVAKLSENHYLLVFASGRRKESVGISLDEMQQLMLVRGATDAINLDGGGTASMYFMGNRIGAVGFWSNTSKSSDRAQYEMLCIGYHE